MKEETALSLKTLLTTYYPSNYKEFYRFFDKESVALLQKEHGKPKVELLSFFKPNRWMEKIHYSWFFPFLESMNTSFAPYFLPFFPKEDKKELKNLLKIEELPSSPGFAPFFLSQLFSKLHIEELLPRAFLPVSDLNVLLDLPKKELILLIDLLGVYDLAFEMRQVVDKNLLTKIHNALSKEETAFLQYALKQPVKWTPPKLNIVSWDGDQKKLKTLLHYRGLYRLAQAAFLETESFKKHLALQLDSGRGKVVMKLFAGKSDPAMIPYFKGQVLDITKRLRLT